jgi:hypothetical protein
MNFGSLPHFLKFKTIKNELKFTAQLGRKPSHCYSARRDGLPRVAARKPGWATAWRPGPGAEASGALRAHRHGHRAYKISTSNFILLHLYIKF